MNSIIKKLLFQELDQIKSNIYKIQHTTANDNGHYLIIFFFCCLKNELRGSLFIIALIIILSYCEALESKHLKESVLA